MSQMVTKEQKSSELEKMLAVRQPQIRSMLPKHLNPERVLRIAHTTITRTPQLLECTPMSLINGVVEASMLGLEVDGVLGQAYLVPFKNKHTGKKEATFIPGYKGLIALHRRSGEITSYEVRSVHEGDEFRWEMGLHPVLVHRPTGEDRGWAKLSHVYAIATYRTGEKQFDVMTRDEVVTIKRRSRAKDSGPWVTDPVEMAKKCVVRRLAKILPVSVEAQRLAMREELVERGIYDGSDAPIDLGEADVKEAEQSTSSANGNGAAKPSGDAPAKKTSEPAPDASSTISEGKQKRLWAIAGSRAESLGLDRSEAARAVREVLATFSIPENDDGSPGVDRIPWRGRVYEDICETLESWTGTPAESVVDDTDADGEHKW